MSDTGQQDQNAALPTGDPNLVNNGLLAATGNGLPLPPLPLQPAGSIEDTLARILQQQQQQQAQMEQMADMFNNFSLMFNGVMRTMAQGLNLPNLSGWPPSPNQLPLSIEPPPGMLSGHPSHPSSGHPSSRHPSSGHPSSSQPSSGRPSSGQPSSAPLNHHRPKQRVTATAPSPRMDQQPPASAQPDLFCHQRRAADTTLCAAALPHQHGCHIGITTDQKHSPVSAQSGLIHHQRCAANAGRRQSQRPSSRTPAATYTLPGGVSSHVTANEIGAAFVSEDLSVSSESDTESEVNSGSESEGDTNSETESKTDSETESKTDSETESKTESESDD